MDFKLGPEWEKHMQRHAKTKEKHGCNDVPTLMQIHVTNTIKQCGKVDFTPCNYIYDYLPVQNCQPFMFVVDP